jgi:hypothetical protein
VLKFLASNPTKEFKPCDILAIHPSIHPPTHPSIHLSDYLSVCLSVALQPLWTLAVFQCLNPIHSRNNCLDGGSVRRKSSTYSQKNTTHKINAHRYPCFEWYSNTRSQCSSGRRRYSHSSSQINKSKFKQKIKHACNSSRLHTEEGPMFCWNLPFTRRV